MTSTNTTTTTSATAAIYVVDARPPAGVYRYPIAATILVTGDKLFTQ